MKSMALYHCLMASFLIDLVAHFASSHFNSMRSIPSNPFSISQSFLFLWYKTHSVKRWSNPLTRTVCESCCLKLCIICIIASKAYKKLHLNIKFKLDCTVYTIEYVRTLACLIVHFAYECISQTHITSLIIKEDVRIQRTHADMPYRQTDTHHTDQAGKAARQRRKWTECQLFKCADKWRSISITW